MIEYKVKKRVVTAEKALEKLELLCSRSEKSTGDARKLLYKWEIAESDVDMILRSLIKDRYIDDSRFAAAYARDKFRFSGWGTRKIEQSLLMKGVDRNIIFEVMQEIVSKDDMSEKLRVLLEKKLKEIEKKEDNSFKIRDKLFRFAVSRGFEFDMISSVIEKMNFSDEYV